MRQMRWCLRPKRWRLPPFQLAVGTSHFAPPSGAAKCEVPTASLNKQDCVASLWLDARWWLSAWLVPYDNSEVLLSFTDSGGSVLWQKAARHCPSPGLLKRTEPCAHKSSPLVRILSQINSVHVSPFSFKGSTLISCGLRFVYQVFSGLQVFSPHWYPISCSVMWTRGNVRWTVLMSRLLMQFCRRHA